MKTIWTAVLMAAMAAALPASSSGQTDVRTLQVALHGERLVLRSFSADPVAQYKWVHGVILPGPVGLHGLEAFLDDSVKLKGGKIILQGNRVTLVQNGTNLASVGHTPMTLQIDLEGADPAVVIPQLQAALFFQNTDSAIASLPAMVAHMLPAAIDKTGQPIPLTKPVCECYRIFKDGNWIEVEKSVSKYSNPVALKMVEPNYSEEARRAKISGAISLAIHVSEKGQVDEVWLLGPLGFGLDENAANAVKQYVFKPAQLDGKPVEAALTVAVNFEIF
jgi:TonB family protein